MGLSNTIVATLLTIISCLTTFLFGTYMSKLIFRFSTNVYNDILMMVKYFLITNLLLFAILSII